jgi:hypothetical protein
VGGWVLVSNFAADNLCILATFDICDRCSFYRPRMTTSRDIISDDACDCSLARLAGSGGTMLDHRRSKGVSSRGSHSSCLLTSSHSTSSALNIKSNNTEVNLLISQSSLLVTIPPGQRYSLIELGSPLTSTTKRELVEYQIVCRVEVRGAICWSMST